MPEPPIEPTNQPPVNAVEDIFASTQPEVPNDPMLNSANNQGSDADQANQTSGSVGFFQKKLILPGVLLIGAIVLCGLYFFLPAKYNFLAASGKAISAQITHLASALLKKDTILTYNEKVPNCPDDLKQCADGSRISRTGLECVFPACPGEENYSEQVAANSLMFGQIADQANQEFFRDSKRLSDISAIKSALAAYFAQAGAYPEKLQFGKNLINPNGSVISFIPRNPEPGGENYAYQSLTADVYALYFYLEADRPNMSKGRYVAWAGGEEVYADSDSDGLADQEEELYGTDMKIRDTDNDGYDDLEELLKGYNPIGSGLFSRRRSTKK